MRKNKLTSTTMSAIAKKVPNQARQTFHALFGEKPNIQGNFKLSKAQREYVLNELSSDLQKLNRDYGFDVSSWGIKI